VKPTLPSIALAAALCCSVTLPTIALAHGSQTHGNHAHGNPATQTVVKEQKPWGIAAEPREAQRTVHIRMGDDMRFQPASVRARH
jgi:hypothetical protein